MEIDGNYLIIGNRTVQNGVFLGRDPVNPKILWFMGADGKRFSINTSYVDEVREQ